MDDPRYTIIISGWGVAGIVLLFVGPTVAVISSHIAIWRILLKIEKHFEAIHELAIERLKQ